MIGSGSESDRAAGQLSKRPASRRRGGPELRVGGVERDRAREEIGRLFANGEHPSTDPSKTYGAYYGESYESFYDQQQHATTSP